MGQPARLEENFVTDLKSSIEMAPGGSRPRRSPRRNLPSFDPVEDELAREPGLVGGPHSCSTCPVLSRNPTPGPKLVPALNSAPIPAPVPASAPPSFDECFQTIHEGLLGVEPKTQTASSGARAIS